MREKKERDDARMLAQHIAERLFTNGFGQRAARLVLMTGNDNLGGWALGPAVDQIEDQIRRWRLRKPGRAL